MNHTQQDLLDLEFIHLMNKFWKIIIICKGETNSHFGPIFIREFIIIIGLIRKFKKALLTSNKSHFNILAIKWWKKNERMQLHCTSFDIYVFWINILICHVFLMLFPLELRLCLKTILKNYCFVFKKKRKHKNTYVY